MPTKHLASALLFTAALSACTPDNGTQNTASGSGDKTGSVKLLNVSYDVARDLYKDFNPLFTAEYKKQHNGADIAVQQSHGGRGQRPESRRRYHEPRLRHRTLG